MKAFKTIKSVIYKLSSVSEYIGWGILLGWVALMTVGTTMRYLLRSPLLFQVEVVSVMLVLFCAFSFAPVFLQGGHIRVDFVTRRLPKQAQDWLWLFAELITLACVTLIIINMMGLISHTLEINVRFEMSRIPEAPFQICLVVGLGLLGLVALVDFCGRFYKLLKSPRRT